MSTVAEPAVGRGRAAGRIAAVLVAVAALGLAVGLTVAHPAGLVTLLPSADMRELHVDFDTFWQSASALIHGTDIYSTPAKLRNLNPPLLSLLLAPLTGLDPLTAYRVFAALTLVLVLAAVVVVCRELRLSWGWTVGATVAMALSSPLHGTLLLGQIYGVLLALLVAGWVCERRGHPVAAGVCYGVAVALKPSLAPVLLLPLVQRRWRSFWAGAAGAGVATVLGALAAGPSSALEWLRIGFTEPVPDVLDNAALPGFLLRLGLPSAIGTALGLVALVGTLVWVVRREADPAGTAPFAVIAAGLLMSPISWHNYLLLLWPGILVAVAAGLVREWAAALLVLALVPVSWGDLWTDGNPWSPLARGLYTAILVAYWATLLRTAPRSGARRF
ncbi:glycosyltransferase family 87 protein [Pseudonocardia xishanensis]|uniref:Arabinofuranan 3-O-arabinosyltransferase n=1 Tax=Pseudonocardia xishanensis TaxID=630995 RepID=A0ABP8RIR3_9PSEU